MTTSMPTMSGRGIPALRRVSARIAAAVNIPQVNPVLLATCAALHAAGSPVIIQATINVTLADTATLSFMLYRGGVEIDATDRWLQHAINLDVAEVVHVHWFDATPGVTPIYSLYAQASAWGGGAYNQAAVPTRLTAFI